MRDQYLTALKNTSQVLTDLTDKPENKPVYNIKAHMPFSLPMKVFVQEYAQVDIWGKFEPAVIKIQGWKDNLNVYLSCSERYPNATNCQASATNEGKIEFYIRGSPGASQHFKFQKSQLFVCFESSLEVTLKINVQFGGEDKAKALAALEQDQEQKAIMQ